MKHKVTKLKVKRGSDANEMLAKKLVRNFASTGALKTTATKAFYLKSLIESLGSRALKSDNASKNVLLPYFSSSIALNKFVDEVKKRTIDGTGSGIVKLKKLGKRFGDAAPFTQIVWTKEIEAPKKAKKDKKAVTKETK